jgi:hypothetical protein
VWDDLGSAVAALFASRPHRIGFLTALDHHGLLVRPVRPVQVASPFRLREKSLGRPPAARRPRERSDRADRDLAARSIAARNCRESAARHGIKAAAYGRSGQARRGLGSGEYHKRHPRSRD